MHLAIIILVPVLVIVCLLMVLVVLMQRPKQEGLGASFGAGVTDQIWGSQTTNVLQKFTVRLAILFFALSLTLCILQARESHNKAGLAVLDSLPTEKIEPKAPTPPVTTSVPVEVKTPAPADATGTPTETPAPAPEAPASTPSTEAPAATPPAEPAPAAEVPSSTPEAPQAPAPVTPDAPK